MHRTAPQEQGSASKRLLDVLAASEDEEPASESLIAALWGKTTEGLVATDDQFKLPDLVLSEAMEGQVPSQEE